MLDSFGRSVCHHPFSIASFKWPVYLWESYNFWKGVNIMPGIVIREGDSFEAALKRFKKQVEKAGVLAEVRKREAFEKPSVKRKKKDIAARKNRHKRGFARGPKRAEK